MKNKLFAVGLGILIVGPAIADDDLTGVDQLLCAPGYVTACTADGECESGPPENWDIPEFIEVDVSALELDAVIHLSEVTLPEGIELTTADLEQDPAVVSIHHAKMVVEEEEEEEVEGEEAVAELPKFG